MFAVDRNAHITSCPTTCHLFSELTYMRKINGE